MLAITNAKYIASLTFHAKAAYLFRHKQFFYIQITWLARFFDDRQNVQKEVKTRSQNASI
jgi:hypothetical protein